MRTFLLCDSPEHAAVVDHLILLDLQDREAAHGSGWSGIYTDGTRFGVLWASPVSDLFEPDPGLVLHEDHTGEWLPFQPEPDSSDE